MFVVVLFDRKKTTIITDINSYDTITTKYIFSLALLEQINEIIVMLQKNKCCNFNNNKNNNNKPSFKTS